MIWGLPISFRNPVGWTPRSAAGPLASLLKRVGRLAGEPAADQGVHPTLLLLLILLAVAQIHAATVAGSVRLVESQDPKVRRKGDYSGVVVWLESTGPQPIEAK